MCRLTPAPTWPRQVALSSDEAVFGGYENASKKYNTEYQTQEGTYDNRPNSFQVTGLSRWLHAHRHHVHLCWSY